MYKYRLQLYKNSSENNVISKQLDEECMIDGYSRTVVDMLNPVIELAGIEVIKYNYCYVQELRRFYYIENVTISPNGVYKMSLRVDVLRTYKADILASYGLITKNQDYNPYTGDPDVETRYTLSKHEFENGFNFTTGDFVLVTMRG